MSAQTPPAAVAMDLPLVEQISHTLREAIVVGEIAAGQKISEPELARRFEVSRAPLREALRQLESKGLVVRIPNVGARVVSLSLAELVDIYAVREAMEGMAARLAAEHMSDTEISELQQLIDAHEQQQAVQENRAYFQHEGDLDFHYRIIVGSKNRKLISLLQGELYHLLRMYRYQFSTSSSRPLKALSEHRRIAEAIAERDGELAELLMRRHISRARKNLLARADSELGQET
ncbi:GntR family transcriptional regulator [Pokkaliibacter sp. CJK22405]|uniref:GntR family transcriptional regulator n=1 Tax=Pokkaliibacter sp. CJK22405 TaxID=3384615 RepID=UPI003984AFEB